MTNRWPWVSIDQPQRGLNKTRKDGKKADKADWRYRAPLQLSKDECRARTWQRSVASGVGWRWQTGKGHQRKGKGERLKTNTKFWCITFLNRTGAAVGARSFVLKYNWTKLWKKNSSRSMKHQLELRMWFTTCWRLGEYNGKHPHVLVLFLCSSQYPCYWQ